MKYFKTSHVIVYLATIAVNMHINFISKHLMLLFIKAIRANRIVTLEFQNISCYCLSLHSLMGYPTLIISKHLMLLFIGGEAYNKIHDSDFKTSYVIVYLAHISPLNLLETFQNILCYCLSVPVCSMLFPDQISKHLMLLFIQIAVTIL